MRSIDFLLHVEGIIRAELDFLAESDNHSGIASSSSRSRRQSCPAAKVSIRLFWKLEIARSMGS